MIIQLCFIQGSNCETGPGKLEGPYQGAIRRIIDLYLTVPVESMAVERIFSGFSYLDTPLTQGMCSVTLYTGKFIK